jgi:glycosyltransferase involved in cell wall biosynthesis
VTGTAARLHIGGRLDIEAWQRLHEAGEVPDRWPYGLHRLADYGVPVRAARPHTSWKQVSSVLRRATGGYEWWETRLDGGDRSELELCWDERVGVPAAWRSQRRGSPAVATGVIWLTDRTGAVAAHRALAGPALRSAYRVWALSSAQLPVLRDTFGVPERRLVHLRFGIDAEFFHPDDHTPPVPGLVVGAGNDQHRDHPTLVAAMAQVQQKVGHARLELATRHPVEIPPELGVRYPSRSHREMCDLYRRGQVVAMALRRNLHVSGVTVALEAMACGRPVVVTDTPGIRDYVTDGETGLLVAPDDPSALATSVAELLLDPARAAALGAAGRRAVEARFTTETMARQLAEELR